MKPVPTLLFVLFLGLVVFAFYKVISWSRAKKLISLDPCLRNTLSEAALWLVGEVPPGLYRQPMFWGGVAVASFIAYLLFDHFSR